MSLYDDTNPQHIEHKNRWSAISAEINARPKWRVELHDKARTVVEVNATTADNAHRLAEAVRGKRMTRAPGIPNEFGATIVRI